MRVGWYTTGAALSILFLFPLVWGGYESFQGQAGSGQESGFGFGNYTRMAEYGEGIVTYLANTAAVSAMTVVGTLVVSALGGYAFARFRFPGRNLLFICTLGILMVPYLVVVHSAIGYVLVVSWRRTGNLAAPGIAHAVSDALRNAVAVL